jgi:NitT/TauT family transport system ATP-binding protein
MKLDVSQLEKVYTSRAGTTQALQSTSFTVRGGEFVSLIGPSGCGKSTLLYMLAGLEDPSGGRIELDGAVVHGPGPDRGMVFQNYTLFPWLTVEQNAKFAFQLSRNVHENHTAGEVLGRIDRAESLLQLMGLTDFFQAYPRQLSGGMKQRVAIVRALANCPKVLLMDEPFGALDAQTREEMQELLLLLHAHERTTIVFVTHDIDEAIYLSTRILVMSPRPGRIVRDLAVPFGPERALDLKVTPEFLQLKRELFDLLHANRPASGSRAELLRRVVRPSPSTVHS